MTKHTVLIVPPGLPFSAGGRATAPRPRKLLGQTRGQAKAGTVGQIDFRELAEQVRLTARGQRKDMGSRLAKEVLEKDHCPAVHPLVNRFGRHLFLALPCRHFGRKLGQRRFRMAPHPEGDEGQKELPTYLERPFDKPGAAGRVFDGLR